MNSKSQFAALEILSRERAAVARKEMEYWLTEAEEWKQLKEAPDTFTGRIFTQLDWCPEPNNH
jgi:hypothetical protein